MHSQQIRRRDDGSIDIPFYRDRGIAARRAAIVSAVRGLWRLATAAGRSSRPTAVDPAGAPSIQTAN